MDAKLGHKMDANMGLIRKVKTDAKQRINKPVQTMYDELRILLSKLYIDEKTRFTVVFSQSVVGMLFDCEADSRIYSQQNNSCEHLFSRILEHKSSKIFPALIAEIRKVYIDYRHLVLMGINVLLRTIFIPRKEGGGSYSCHLGRLTLPTRITIT
uniref:Uncharacterized protein n=1 Tax=Romanomermis culicivorax TaxID=13658 RepID=A0A915KDK0_ROMCU